VVVKVCLIVLAVMAVVTFSESYEDRGDFDGLGHLDSLAKYTRQEDGPSLALVCKSVQEYADSSQNTLLFAGLVPSAAEPVLWDQHGCTSSLLDNGSSRLMDIVENLIYTSGLRADELTLYCLPSWDCVGDVRSVALFDTQVSVRHEAEGEILYTVVVVSLMCIFALIFMRALNKVNTRMLHPLWSILDDMASLRSLEAVRLANFQPANEMLRDLQKGAKKDLPGWKRFMGVWRKGFAALAEGEKMEDAVELADLRRSLSSMRSALRSWAKYVPPYLLKSLYRSGVEAAVGVRYCEVTVFFCDIDGFRDLCRDLTPQDVLNLLGLVHGEVSNAIEGAAGTLLEFVGDEVLAVFNAPNELIDHAEHAVGAATDVLERASRLGVRVRCGLHSGKVLVGNIGSPTRIKYGVLGDGVNVAARLKSLNSHYGTCCLISDECLDEVYDAHKTYLVRPVGNLVLKGRSSSTKVWEVPALRNAAPVNQVKTFDLHRQAFQLFQERRFREARPMFFEISRSLKGSTDGPAQHLLNMCDKYIREPPPEDWDGSELMTKK